MHSRTLDINGLDDGDGGVYRYSLIWSIYPIYSPFVFIPYFCKNCQQTFNVFIVLFKVLLTVRLFEHAERIGLVKQCEVSPPIGGNSVPLSFCPSYMSYMSYIQVVPRNMTVARGLEGRLDFWYNSLHLVVNLILEVKF